MATRRQYSGNAPASVLQTAMTAGSPTAGGTINISTGTGANYPDGSVGPFFIVIDRGTASEEKILISSRSSDTLTISARGADGTSAASHTSGTAVVEHVVTKTDIDEANAHITVTTQDDHTQYLNTTRHQTAHNALPLQLPHTWAIGADVRVPSGDTDYIPGFFVAVPSGQTVKLVKLRHRINSGTSATVKVQVNGADATGFTGVSVTTASTTTDPADVTLADGDYVTLVVTAVSASPRNMSVTAFLEFQRI